MLSRPLRQLDEHFQRFPFGQLATAVDIAITGSCGKSGIPVGRQKRLRCADNFLGMISRVTEELFSTASPGGVVTIVSSNEQDINMSKTIMAAGRCSSTAVGAGGRYSPYFLEVVR